MIYLKYYKSGFIWQNLMQWKLAASETLVYAYRPHMQNRKTDTHTHTWIPTEDRPKLIALQPHWATQHLCRWTEERLKRKEHCQVPGCATCRRESEEGEAGRLEERRLRESSHWSTKNRREGSGSGYKIQDGEKKKEILNKKLHTDLSVRNLGVLDLYLNSKWSKEIFLVPKSINGAFKPSILLLAHPCLVLKVKLTLEHGHSSCELPLKALSSPVWWFLLNPPQVENTTSQEAAEGKGGVLLTHTLFTLCRAPHWRELGPLLGKRRFYHLINSEQR